MDQLIATTSADDFMKSVNEIKSGFTLESATNGAEVGVEWITESGDDPSGLVEDLYLNVFNKAAQGVSTAAMQARELMEQDFQRWEDEANAREHGLPAVHELGLPENLERAVALLRHLGVVALDEALRVCVLQPCA